MPDDDDNILAAGTLQDPGSEAYSKSGNISLRMEKMKYLLMFYGTESAHMSGRYQEKHSSPHLH